MPKKPIKLGYLTLLAALAPLCAVPADAQDGAMQPQELDAVEAAAARVKVAEHVEAIEAVDAVVDAIEQRSSRYDLALVPPLVVLGDALAGIGDRDAAFGAYDRALHITRVNRGLHHSSQVSIVYREAALLAKGGDYGKANSRHEYAYRVLLRSYGGDSPELLPGLFALADWYQARYNIFSARALYEHAAQVAAEHLPPEHSARVRALRSIAATYRSERFPPFYIRRGDSSPALGSYTGFQYRRSQYSPAVNSFAKGERALIEVVNIFQARQNADDEEVAAAMLELGDWFLMFEKHHRATALYRRVWELLQGSPALRAESFQVPTPLYMPLPGDPDKPDDAAPGEVRKGVVELSFTVDEHGLVSHIDTLRSEPEDMMGFKVRRAVKRARYRPAFDGQMPLATNDVRVEHTFVYYSSGGDDAAARSSSGAATRSPLAQANSLAARKSSLGGK